jgi:pSer/pThr/pTyr-binding forkhead associated (FHA) protein
MSIKLLVVHGSPQGKSLRFPHGEYVIGRGAECHVRPNSDWVSRQHCMLRVTPEAAVIRDLGSRNGTLVNGQRVVGEQQLSHGDHLQVGPVVFEVQVEVPAAVPGPGAALVETGIFCGDTSELPPVGEVDAPPAPAPQETPQGLPPSSTP